METIQQILLREIRTFCKRTGMAETTFGQKAVREWTLVQRLEAGRSIETKTIDRARAFIASYEGPSHKESKRCMA